MWKKKKGRRILINSRFHHKNGFRRGIQGYLSQRKKKMKKNIYQQENLDKKFLSR